MATANETKKAKSILLRRHQQYDTITVLNQNTHTLPSRKHPEKGEAKKQSRAMQMHQQHLSTYRQTRKRTTDEAKDMTHPRKRTNLATERARARESTKSFKEKGDSKILPDTRKQCRIVAC